MNYNLLYSYINANIIDNENISFNSIDSISCNTNDFFEKIIDTLNIMPQNSKDTKTVNLFCICGSSEDIENIQKTISNDIVNHMANNIKKEKCVNNSSTFYNKFLDIFTTYLINSSLSPLAFSLNIDDIAILYLFGCSEFHSEPPLIIKKIVDMWYVQKYPVLCGKQIITQNFYFQNLVNRKALKIISSQNDNDLYLLLEGNIKVKLDYSSISTYNYLDTNSFSNTDIISILYNPVYAFGYMFYPDVIFLDWFNVYLYAIAILEINLSDMEKLKSSYLSFLIFIDNNICKKIYADKAIISHELFFEALRIHIQSIKEFIKR